MSSYGWLYCNTARSARRRLALRDKSAFANGQRDGLRTASPTIDLALLAVQIFPLLY